MKLKYFNINNSLAELKNERNRLVKKFHPDKVAEVDKAAATEVMKAINVEYEYCIDPRNRLANNNRFVGDPKLYRAHGEQLSKDSVQAAQNIFHALTNGSGVDFNFLYKTIGAVNDWKQVLDAYQRKYGISTIMHIQKQVTDKETQESIITLIKTISGVQDLFGTFSKYF